MTRLTRLIRLDVVDGEQRETINVMAVHNHGDMAMCGQEVRDIVDDVTHQNEHRIQESFEVTNTQGALFEDMEYNIYWGGNQHVC